MTTFETNRDEIVQNMTLDALEALSHTIRHSLDHADATANTLREWLKRVEDEIERKAGF